MSRQHRGRTLIGLFGGLFWLLVLLAAGCGGGGAPTVTGGGGATMTAAGGGGVGVSGLTISDTVSAVTAKTLPGLGKATAKTDAPDTKVHFTVDTTALGSFATDPTTTYVRDDTIDALKEANAVLCVSAQTGYDQMVNRGEYIALVDTTSCFQRGGDESASSSTGESSGSSETNFDRWVVSSSRLTSTSDQIVSIWADVAVCGGGPSGTVGCRVFGKTVMTAGKSAAYPYGLFTAHYKANVLKSDGTLGAAKFQGTLTTTPASGGQVALAFYSKEGNVETLLTPGAEASLRKVSALLSINAATGDAVSGRAYVFNREKRRVGAVTEDRTTEANVAYNSEYVRSSPDGGVTNTCFSRNGFTPNIWRYGLYKVLDGSRVQRNAGFPIKTLSGAVGFIGYWGLWVPPDVPATDTTDGARVTRQTFGGGAGDAYTLVNGPGKLIKHTTQPLTLTELVSVPLDYFDASLRSQVRAEWSGTNFVNKQVFQSGPQGGTWVPITPLSSLTLSAHSRLGFWSQALGGQVSIIVGATAAAGDMTVVFYKETNVANQQMQNLLLYCYTRCLRATITQAQANLGGQPGGAYLPELVSTAFSYQYQFNKDTLTLTSAGSPVTLLASVTAVTGQHSWGFKTGPMVTTPLTQGRTHETWNQAEFYTWETGPNRWNTFTAVKDSTGAFVIFDPPLQILYTHRNENDANFTPTTGYVSPYYGRKFLLEYRGVGELGGIPWVPLSGDSHGRGTPAFGLKTGVVVNPDEQAPAQYKVKALNREQAMAAVEDGRFCDSATLNTSTGLTPPTDMFVDPGLSPTPPTVTAAPAVIKGVLQ